MPVQLSSMPLLHRFLLLVAISCPLLGLCSAIYENQVGIWDWHQQYIGKVNHAAFQTQGAGRKRVVVTTEQNVIASLDLRRGEIFWKHVFDNSDNIDGLELVLGKYVLTLSHQGSTIRAWHLPDGQLIWETSLQSPGAKPLLFLTTVDNNASGKGKVVLVLGEKLLHGVSSIDGALLWTIDFLESSNDREISIKRVVQYDDERIYAVGLARLSGFSVWDIDAKTGHLNYQKIISFQGELSSKEVIVVGFTVIGLDSRGENIVFSSIDDISQATTHVISIKDLIPNGHGRPCLKEESLNELFAIQFSNQITLVKLDSSRNNLEAYETFEGYSVISKGVELLESKAAFTVVQHINANQIALHFVIDGGGKIIVSNELLDLDAQKGSVQKAYLNTYIRNDRSHGFRVLVISEDASLSLLQQREVVWSREDGLACIIEASPAELPLEKDGVSVAQVEHSLLEWLKGHWLKLKTTLMLAGAEEAAIMQNLRLNSEDKTKMYRDHNGFRKLLVILTEAGKLYALHTGDGRIVWSSFISEFRTSSSSSSGEKITMLKLLPWQVSQKHTVEENPVFLVAAKFVTKDDWVGLLAWVDAYSGKEKKLAKLTYLIEQIIPLPFTDSTDQRLHIIIDDHTNAHLFPSSDESLQIFLEHVHSTYFYTIDEEAGIITGFVIKGRQAESAISPSDGILFQSQELWTVIFPSDSEKIVATTTRRLDEAVHTQAKVLTNQDVLYKYLNKNTLFVATAAPRGSDSFGETSPEENWLVAYVIDIVTGRILYRLKHPNMRGPLHAVFSENWIVYHYFNVRAHRFEFSVIEMYDRNRVDNKNVLRLMLGKHNATAASSSYSLVDLDVKTQSYFFLHSIKALTVTTTASGITGKQILVGNVGDQILALDKRFFDPRRTLEPTQAEKEDGIIPLTDAIPIQPQFYLSHAYQVEGLRGIISVPARLESTSLVFSYGVDLFYTHTAPSRIYDSLTDEFNYALLLITIFALLIAIIITWFLSERKELRDKWK